MKDMITKQVETPAFINAELNKVTNDILKVGNRIQKNLYEIAFLLSTVEEKESFKEDGFKSTAEYAMETFGFKKTMAYTLLKVGKEYTSAKLESNLPHVKGKDFSVTQIEKVLPLKERMTVVGLVEDGEITPEMTCKEISEVIKSKLPPKEIKEPKEESGAGEDGTDQKLINLLEALKDFRNCLTVKEHFEKTAEIEVELLKIGTELIK